ncbi:MAG: helix-turn-helix domain-containing protein [Myxococcales bacterium]|nr:helix-turn-helix domain-containing protein [Myxococcales bacterium]MCB9641840.1 helix-turn-helix domain-containing protein [Myxococcales bacterium]
MTAYSYVPVPPLSKFVAMFWHDDAKGFAHEKEQILPDGSMEWVINLRKDEIHIYDHKASQDAQRYGGSLLLGPQSQPMVIDTADQDAILGVHFHPGGAYALLGVPLEVLHNQCVSLSDVLGQSATELYERLVLAPSLSRRFWLLEEFLLRMYQRFEAMSPHPAVRYALRVLQCDVSPTIREIEESKGLSARRFIELFRREVGMTPKRFARLCRFQQSLSFLFSPDGEQKEWAEIALLCGYCDQSHFNRDFRLFSGMTPSLYVERHRDHPNHVILLGS